MHQRLSKETLYFRYLALYRPTMADLETICNLTFSEGAAFVAHRQGNRDAIVGLVYYRRHPLAAEADPEFAIVVEDCYQARGIGRLLFEKLCRHATQLGIKRLNASVHADNKRMLNLLQQSGYPVRSELDVDTMEFTVLLESDAAAAGRGFFGTRRLDEPLAGFNMHP